MPSHHTVADSDDEDADAAPGGDGVENMLVRCTELKTKGNEHFKAGELGAATTAYEEAVSKLTSKVGKKALGDYFKARPGAMDTASPLLASLHTNLAAVHVKAQQWQSALKAATEALKVEPQNIKARFRRGVAESNLGQFDEAKADLTAVIRADPKNREARTVLEVCNAAIKERTSSEKAMFGKAFDRIAKEEEAKAAKAAKEAAAARAAEEAKLLKEWRDECEELRKDAPPNATIGLLAAAARAGDVEAQENLDRLAPITLKEFAEAKAKAAAKEAERLRKEHEKEEAARKAAREKADALSRQAKADVVQLAADDEDEAELLKGLNKGYKTRADGSKTSYFDRSEQVDPKTKALLEAQKAPKRIDVSDPSVGGGTAGGAAAARGGGGGGGAASSSCGSAWNAAGTYEERDVTTWAMAELKARLAAIAIDVAGGRIGVKTVADVEGSASIIANRGKVKRPFEFKLDLTWEAHDGDPANACEGSISFMELSPAPTGHSTACVYESAERFTKAPPSAALERVKQARAALQQGIDSALRDFVDALGRK